MHFLNFSQKRYILVGKSKMIKIKAACFLVYFETLPEFLELGIKFPAYGKAIPI
jgi:hypothetical protein